jgi:hypothetical protein
MPAGQIERHYKKSASSGTTATLVPVTSLSDTIGHPQHLGPTQIDLTFASSAARLEAMGPTTDGFTFVVRFYPTSV